MASGNTSPLAALNDWRAWTNQQELASGTAFPGQNAFTDSEIITSTAADEAAILTVSAATTANPSVLTTSVAHGYTTGEIVAISGAAGTGTVATVLNGAFPVTVLSPTTFSIPVNNTGTYTASSASVQAAGVYPSGVLGTYSTPTYANTPTAANATDPFNGWTSIQENGPTVSITGISAANPGVVTTASATGWTTGQQIVISGVTGKTEANGVWTITVVSSTTFSIPVDCTAGSFGGTALARLDIGRPALTGVTS